MILYILLHSKADFQIIILMSVPTEIFIQILRLQKKNLIRHQLSATPHPTDLSMKMVSALSHKC